MLSVLRVATATTLGGRGPPATSAMPSPCPTAGLYALQDTANATQQLKKQYQRILTPLSLFPASCSRLKSPIQGESLASSAQKPAAVPLSQAALVQLVKGRMALSPHWENVCVRAQKVFREIILAEVRRIWKDAQRSLYDPAFSTQMNRELYQHLVTYIGLVCQHLFLHYLCLMEHRGALGVFTDCANITRFSAQLSLDCSNFLNVAAVRHRLVMDRKTLQTRQPEPCVKRQHSQLARTSVQTLGCRMGFTINYFIKLTKPHVPSLRQKIARDIKELEELPSLDMSKIKPIILPDSRQVFLRHMPCTAVTTPCPRSGEKAKPERARKAASSIVKKSQSLPNMRDGRLLADELGISLTPRSLTPDVLCRYIEFTEEGELKGLMDVAEDLRRLVQGSVLKKSRWTEELDEESELPPLIKALTRRKANEVHYQQLQRMLTSLQREETVEKQQRDNILSAPALYPQATTLNVAVHNRMVVKAADLQVSERTCHETVTMERCPPVYNHLLGEIDDATIKSLDASLSAGEEVRELYKELMNTVPNDYLKFDLGTLVEPPAADIDLFACYASSTLMKKKGEQIINEKLSEILPVGPFVPDDVVDTPTTPNLPFKKKGSKKEFISWLKWWQATFNTDDFLKYISTKDSDYLQVIFHLFSHGEDMVEAPIVDEAIITKRAVVTREEKDKATELQSKKEEYESGKWNANSVMIGGLGTLVASDHHLEDLKVMQRRLERLWTVLHFPEQERLNMAIKYSSNRYYLQIPEMLQAWELAAQTIQERELVLAELEKFEQTASDPNRFFNKATRSFASRLKESRIRSQLYCDLAQCESELYVLLYNIKETFNDTVTFRGRPYLAKMESDTVEMLYWLQQERRAIFLNKVTQKEGQRRKLTSLVKTGILGQFTCPE